MSWTDERVEKLRELWGAGKSASEIADELGNVSRNAVIGKAHRLGLSGRPSPIKSKPGGKAKAAPKEPPGVTILTLTERMCRWPIGDPKEPGFCFCGKPSNPGVPYCPAHAAIAYQNPNKKRDEEAAKPAATS